MNQLVIPVIFLNVAAVGIIATVMTTTPPPRPPRDDQKPGAVVAMGPQADASSPADVADPNASVQVDGKPSITKKISSPLRPPSVDDHTTLSFYEVRGGDGTPGWALAVTTKSDPKSATSEAPIEMLFRRFIEESWISSVACSTK